MLPAQQSRLDVHGSLLLATQQTPDEAPVHRVSQKSAPEQLPGPRHGSPMFPLLAHSAASTTGATDSQRSHAIFIFSLRFRSLRW
jgi:hypothetical protein